MSQLLKSSGAMGAATLASRVLGMVREMVYSAFMGDTWVAGAFMLAFTIPNLFRRLLGEGALTAAFIPVFKEKEKTAGDAEMWRAANAVLTGLMLATAAATLLVVAGISAALWLHRFEDEMRLMLELLRWMFPYLLFVCPAAVFIGMLNSRGHFFLPALGPVLLNVVMIASVLWLAPQFGMKLDTQIFALAVGVLVAGAAQAFYQLPALRREGFRFEWVSPRGNETVQRVARQLVPAALGVAAFQLNVVVTQGFAFAVDPQIVASFNYAVRLMELPQGVFGISLATYLLPTLAGLAAEKKFDDFCGTLRHGIGHLVFVNLLASILLVLLAEPIVRLLFERGRFGPDATGRAALALACLAPGLLAFSLVNVLSRAFYALGDVRTPMRISVFCLGANALLALLLVVPLRQGGLGVANTMSAVLNVALLAFALRKKIPQWEWDGLRRETGLLIPSALLAIAVAWTMSRAWEAALGHASLVLKLGSVFVPMLAATVVYFGAAWLLKHPAAGELAGFLQKARRNP
ncbi:MAG: murein biosynthesis integral membrane protein MurJ [Verrucomicrobia bacterium]|nr:murein biosynthesis integral membrane protein MurJ [Verrucomicrobiota bacterium]